MKIKSNMIRKSCLFALLPNILIVTIFLVFPLVWIFRISFYEDIPGGYMKVAWILDNYKKFLLDAWYLKNVLWLTIKVAFLVTSCVVIVAYPLALAIAKVKGKLKQILLTMTLSPQLIGMVCLTFGWTILYRNHGLINQLTMAMGLTSEPIKYMYSLRGVIITMVYISVPYMVLNLLDGLSRINPSLEEAAMSVGANRIKTFAKIIFPMSFPGLYAGLLVSFSLNFAALTVPLMIGSQRTKLIGVYVYDQAMNIGNLPFGSSIAVILLVVSSCIGFLFTKIANRLFFKRLGVK